MKRLIGRVEVSRERVESDLLHHRRVFKVHGSTSSGVRTKVRRG